MDRPRVTVVGSLHHDIMVEAPDRPRRGETVTGSRWYVKAGGKGGNQAVEAARHGAAVAMVGRVGTDAFGDVLLDNLVAHGVGTEFVARVPDAGSGMSVAILDAQGDYGAVIVSGANLGLGPDALEAAVRAFEGCRVCVLQNEIPDAANLDAARRAKAVGARVVLNAAPARPAPPGLLDLVDVLVVNAVEAEMLGGGPVASPDDAARAATALARAERSVIVTAGGDGLALAEPGQPVLRLPAHPVRVASTHGAGDCFIGALAARLAAGVALRDAAAYANAAAALFVAGRLGADGRDPATQVAELLATA